MYRWITSSETFIPGLIFFVGILIRILYVFRVEPFLHWDEAPQAFMAQQIAGGHVFPLVYFQLPYIGAVEQYPLALLMLLLGDSVLTVNLFYFTLSVLSLGGAYLLYRCVLPGYWSDLAFLFFALSPPILLLFSLQSYSFGSLLLFEAGILWLFLYFCSGPRMDCRLLLPIVGFCSGLALYNNILIVGILGFCVWFLIKLSPRRSLLVFTLAFLVGYAPMIYFNLTNEFISYKLLVSKFLGVTRDMVASQGIFRAVVQGGLDKLAGLGPKSDFWLFLAFPQFASAGEYCLQFAAFFIFISTVILSIFTLFSRGSGKFSETLFQGSPEVRRALYVFILMTVVITISTVRNMIALVPLVPILMCEGLALCQRFSRKLVMVSALCLISYLAVGHVKVIARESKDPYSQVYQFLEENRLTHGYGSYHFQSYVAFLSKGKIKISPQIGPAYFDKIPRFSQIVDQTEQVFYILPADFSLTYLHQNNIRYQIEKIDDWLVVWNLSERVFPQDLLPPETLLRKDGYKRWSYRENPAVMNPYRGGH